MERYHVLDILIDRPHIKKTIYLPMAIKHITGVMFFPVIPPPDNGVPDGEPLGTAGLSLQNEQLNVVTNMNIYKKTPLYYESTDFKNAGGEVFLDRGYSKHDFFECNDTVSANSFIIFKYTNRKMVVSMNDTQRFNIAFNKLKSLVSENVYYDGYHFNILEIQTIGDLIVIKTSRTFRDVEIHKSRLNDEIYRFIDPMTSKPFFTVDDGDEDFDKAFVMKTILRYDDIIQKSKIENQK